MPYGNAIYYCFFAGTAGLLSAWLYWTISEYAKATGNALLASVAIFPVFALAVIGLILLCCGLPMPVYHHVGLVAAYACMMAYGAGQSELVVLLWGISLGIISHFAADLLADLFLVYGDGYVDPPSLSMAVCSLIVWILFPALGLYNGMAGVVTPIVLCVVISIVIQKRRNALVNAETAAPEADETTASEALEATI